MSLAIVGGIVLNHSCFLQQWFLNPNFFMMPTCVSKYIPVHHIIIFTIRVNFLHSTSPTSSKIHLLNIVCIICRSGEEIAVVYYRAGYTPNDYPTEKVEHYIFFSSQRISVCME